MTAAVRLALVLFGGLVVVISACGPAVVVMPEVRRAAGQPRGRCLQILNVPPGTEIIRRDGGAAVLLYYRDLEQPGPATAEVRFTPQAHAARDAAMPAADGAAPVILEVRAPGFVPRALEITAATPDVLDAALAPLPLPPPPAAKPSTQRSGAKRAPPPASQALVDRAYERFVVGRYEAALVDYEEALRRSGDDGLRYEIAECQRRLGRTEEALRAYEEFLARAPLAQHRAAARLAVQLLKANP